jgi:RNA polymerase sigma factor (sigma-70 family)
LTRKISSKWCGYPFFADREAISQFERPDQLVWYLVAMARNKVISELRHSEAGKGGDIRRTRSLTLLESQNSEPPSKDATPSHVVVVREELQKLLEQSTDRDRQIIELRISGKTFGEIGNALDIDERTARRAISRLVKIVGADD